MRLLLFLQNEFFGTPLSHCRQTWKDPGQRLRHSEEFCGGDGCSEELSNKRYLAARKRLRTLPQPLWHMAMIEEFERTGNWLFRGRSYFPLFWFGLMAAVIGMQWDDHFQSFDIASAAVCISISMLGLIIRSLTIGYTPRGTSGRNTKQGQVAEVLNTKGMYSLVRHPLYLGNFFMWLGIMVYVGNFWFVAVCCLLYWLYYERIMFAEEAFLRGKFGQTYLTWSETVPAFWPKTLRWHTPEVSFSLRNVLKREYNGFFAIFLCLAVVSAGKNAVGGAEGWEAILVPFWQYTLIATFIVFFTLRSLKRFTRVLHVEGR